MKNLILFSTRNLFYKDYKWTSYINLDPRVCGNLDTTLFNALEGNEVVYLINNLMVLWDYRFSNTGNKIERLIHDKLPPEIKSQEDVMNWIQASIKF
jgi:hypothetical protein